MKHISYWLAALTLGTALLTGCQSGNGGTGAAATDTPMAATSPLAATATTAPAPAATATIAASAFPLTLKDDSGQTVTFSAPVQRIVSLAPSNTEIAISLGLTSRIVGITTNDDSPAVKGKPIVGDYNPSLEKIVAQHPDVVLEISGETKLVNQMQAQGLKVIVLEPTDFAGVYHDIALVGQMADVPAAATTLVQNMRQTVQAVQQALAGAKTHPSVLYEISYPPFYTAGPNTFIDTIISMAGGVNAAHGAPIQWPQLSAEAIIKDNPDVIILGDTAYGAKTTDLAKRPGWTVIAAVAKNHVYAIDDNLISRPGPRIVLGVVAMAKLLNPELASSLPR